MDMMNWLLVIRADNEKTVIKIPIQNSFLLSYKNIILGLVKRLFSFFLLVYING